MPSAKDLFRRLTPASWRTPAPARPRRHTPVALKLEGLEDRVVLSHFGGHLGARAASRLATAAVSQTTSSTSTSMVLSGGTAGDCATGLGATQDAQLNTDLTTLRTDVNAAISGSTVTDAQRLALRTDLRTLATAGFRFDKTTLAPVIDSLLTAVADGTYDSDPTVAEANKAAFTALFSGSSVTQVTIDTTYADILAVARNLNLSTTELTTISADRTAIQADLTRLGITSTRFASQTNLDLVLGGYGGGDFGRGFGGFGRRGGRGRF